MAEATAVRDDARMLSRQARYHRRKRRGFVMFHPVVDPQELRDLIVACGFRLLDTDPATLAEGVERVVESFSSGRLHVAAAPE